MGKPNGTPKFPSPKETYDLLKKALPTIPKECQHFALELLNVYEPTDFWSEIDPGPNGKYTEKSIRDIAVKCMGDHVIDGVTLSGLPTPPGWMNEDVRKRREDVNFNNLYDLEHLKTWLTPHPAFTTNLEELQEIVCPNGKSLLPVDVESSRLIEAENRTEEWDKYRTQINRLVLAGKYDAVIAYSEAHIAKEKSREQDAEPKPENYILWKDLLATDFDNEPPWYIPGLISHEGTVLAHGQPRAGKSLVILHLLTCIASGEKAFGSIETVGPMPVAYFSNEDPKLRIYQRIQAMLKGSGIKSKSLEDTLLVSPPRGLSFDSPEDQKEIIRIIKKHKSKIVAFDPLRMFTSKSCQGPGELAPVAHYLKEIQIETGATIILIHHDVKPPRGNTVDDRDSTQKASGGAIFGISDVPLSFERGITLNDKSLNLHIIPSMVKFSADPEPTSLHLAFDLDKNKNLTKISFSAKAVTKEDLEKEKIEPSVTKILLFLKNKETFTGTNKFKDEITGNKDNRLKIYDFLIEHKLIKIIGKGPRNANIMRLSAEGLDWLKENGAIN